MALLDDKYHPLFGILPAVTAGGSQYTQASPWVKMQIKGMDKEKQKQFGKHPKQYTGPVTGSAYFYG